ncbi:hypothetical protein, partial [Thalassotalea fusca]
QNQHIRTNRMEKSSNRKISRSQPTAAYKKQTPYKITGFVSSLTAQSAVFLWLFKPIIQWVKYG